MVYPAAKRYSFGEFRLDVEEKLLIRNETAIPLPPKVMDILCLLVERQGKLVSKNEIMETVWADSFVEESNLTQGIYTLRRALGNDESGKSVIETVPRRGFRIAVPIIELADEPKAFEVSKTPEKPELRFWTKSRLLIAGVICVLIVGSLLVFAVSTMRSERPASAPIENVSLQKLTFSGDINTPAVSPDGKTIAFVRNGELFIQDISTGSSVKLNVVDHSVFANLQFSLNGESLYFRNERRTNAGGDIFQVSRFGGAASKILENCWSGIGVSPDGKSLSFVRYFPKEAKWILFVRDIASGDERQVFERNSPDTIYRTGFPAWSPDSKRLAIVAQEKPFSKLYLVDAATGESVLQETPRFVQIEQTIWSVTNKAVFIVGREKDRFFQLWKLNLPGGDLQRITNDLSIYRHISLSGDGKSLVAEKQSLYSHLWIAEQDGSNEMKQITNGNLNRDGNAGVSWTPDGDLVYSSRISGDIDLWYLRLKDGVATQLTKNSGLSNENPVVSPDGKYIYFESTRTGLRHIWRIDIDGNNPTQISFSEKETEFFPTVSADGRFLYFLKKSAQGNAVLRKDLIENKIQIITEQTKYSPNSFLSLSADGKRLAFHNIKDRSDEASAAKSTEIGIIYLDEDNKVRLFSSPQLGGTFHWTADSDGFEFIENSPEGAKIFRTRLASQEAPELVLQLPDTQLFHFLRSFDMKKIVLARGKSERDVILLKNFE